MAIEQVLHSIWNDKENEFVTKPKRKKRETMNISSINSEESSPDENSLFIQNPTKRMKKSYLEQVIEETESYRIHGMPKCCKKYCLEKITAKDVENARKHIYGMGKEDKKDYIHSFTHIII